MTITELIAALEALRAEHGDISVFADMGGAAYSVRSLEVDDERVYLVD